MFERVAGSMRRVGIYGEYLPATKLPIDIKKL